MTRFDINQFKGGSVEREGLKLTAEELEARGHTVELAEPDSRKALLLVDGWREVQVMTRSTEGGSWSWANAMRQLHYEPGEDTKLRVLWILDPRQVYVVPEWEIKAIVAEGSAAGRRKFHGRSRGGVSAHAGIYLGQFGDERTGAWGLFDN